jgi:hypothetical protein
VVQVVNSRNIYNSGSPFPAEASRAVFESAQRHRDGRQEAREQRPAELADDNAATAPGKVCELCGSVITASQEARLRVDGEWIHEACPIQ